MRLCWVAIIPALSASAQSVPADYKAYFAAGDAFGSGKYAEALAALGPIWTFQPTSPLAGYAALTAARSYLELSQPAQARETLQRYAALLPQPAGSLLLAKAAEAAGDLAVAADAYQRVFYQFPLSTEADESEAALERLDTLAGTDLPPAMPSVVFERAEKLRRSGQTARAKKELLAAATRFAGIDRELALVRANQGDYRALAALRVNEPEADAERIYLMHAASRRNSQLEQAESALRELRSRYPKSRWTMEGLISWGNHHLLRNNTAEFEPLYRACTEGWSSDPQAAYCHWKVAWSAWMRRDPNAKSLFEEHLRRFPESEKASAALYFLGRHQLLAERYPLSFYTTLITTRPASATTRVESAAFTPTAATRLRVDRAKQLEAAGFPDWAEFELKYAAQDQPYVAAMELADIVSKRGTYDKALRYVKGLAKGYLSVPIEAAPQRFWKLAFPLPYANAVSANSRARELDPNLVAALIRQESEFNPNAVSRAKAYGLTQVLPSTGRQISRRVGIRGFRASMLFQPDVNLKLGTYYLKSMLEVNGGRWEQTLASYNAGQTRVNEWRSWYEYREPAEFIESIPFSETRTYVQTVLRNADVYRKIYGQRWR